MSNSTPRAAAFLAACLCAWHLVDHGGQTALVGDAHTDDRPRATPLRAVDRELDIVGGSKATVGNLHHARLSVRRRCARWLVPTGGRCPFVALLLQHDDRRNRLLDAFL